jgi:alkylation response protein AidB-like acyl-CoA dehydrogenase
MAIGALGVMRRLIETSVAYALDREAFGRPIGKFQAIRHQIAEMATEAEAARAQTYGALRIFHQGHSCVKEVSMSKLLTQRAALRIADQSLQIHGGYGYMREYGIERAVRDARLGPIGGGTDEIMKEIIGKTMGL